MACAINVLSTILFLTELRWVKSSLILEKNDFEQVKQDYLLGVVLIINSDTESID